LGWGLQLEGAGRGLEARDRREAGLGGAGDRGRGPSRIQTAPLTVYCSLKRGGGDTHRRKQRRNQKRRYTKTDKHTQTTREKAPNTPKNTRPTNQNTPPIHRQPYLHAYNDIRSYTHIRIHTYTRHTYLPQALKCYEVWKVFFRFHFSFLL
jgi:hypothetical protein